MLETEIKYSYNDVMIKPATVSYFTSRKEANPFYEDKLPIFTAPMDSVINLENQSFFEENGINTILPRTISINDRLNNLHKELWSSFSLKEFNEYFLENTFETEKPIKTLIDVANGHMSILYTYVKKAKEKYSSKIIIMLGNIANPETYLHATNFHVDYVRCSIGTGRGCLSSSNVGIHYPIASLLDEINKIKHQRYTNDEIKKGNYTKIIADGGVRNYSDAIKALALGADYVMIGGLFASLLESSGKLYQNHEEVNLPFLQMSEEEKRIFLKEQNLTKLFYGMSTKKAQDLCGKIRKTTSEGLICQLPCQYTLKQWTENFIDYLRSAMSYTNNFNLYQFINFTKLIVISQNTINSINK